MGAEEAEQPNGLVVVPAPRPRKGLASWALDLLESLVVRLGHDKTKPLHWLSGNFAPVVDETPPAPDLPVRGHLPECLNGEFVRVGPNPKFVPVAGYHWFDGDGMIHAMRIKDGKATYVSRYVKTARLKQEEYFGGAKFMKVSIKDVVKVLEDGDLQTLGLLDYEKRLKHSFTAHPKVDPFTDEMFTFGYSHEPPYCTYRVITKDGTMLDPVPITIPESVMMHDFAITENYSIFMDLPLLFRPKEMVKNGEFIYKFDPTKKARFGILPRYAKDDKLIRWFELPNCFIFHNANAWEDGDEVVLITCRLENPDLDKVNGHQSDKLENFGNELYEMRFNMKTGAASQKQLSVSAVDFPRVNESYTGRKSEVNVIDAKTMSPDPVAVVELPNRVPYGFHAFFVTEEQLAQQAEGR
nr:unnamed protein product [Digitaria exilis]